MPLKYRAKVIAGQAPPGETVHAAESRVEGVPFIQGNAEFGDQHPSPRLVATGPCKFAPPGATLVSVRAPVGALNIADTRLAIGRGVAAVVAKPEYDRRFLWWVLNARVPDLASSAVGSTYAAVGADDIARLRVPDPPVAQQHLIAEFLDRECERIGRLMRELDGIASTVHDLVSQAPTQIFNPYGVALPNDVADREAWQPLPKGWRLVVLGQVLRELTNGYVGPTRDLLVDEGIPYIQSTHVKHGVIDFSRRPFFVPREWHDAHPRINLAPDDVLIVQTGGLGEVACVTTELGPASCHALLIARADPALLSGPYLAAWFRTTFGRHSLLKMATGALHPHLEAGEVRKLHVLVPPPSVQEQFVRAAALAEARERRASQEIDDFRNKLVEYRDALITEAVSGRIDIDGLAEAGLGGSLESMQQAETVESLST